jgi:hypothetical protein
MATNEPVTRWPHDGGPPVARSPEASTGRLALHCVRRVVQLLVARQLHLDRGRVGQIEELTDGRRFTIYRESSSSEPCDGESLRLEMWFRLRWVPPGARLRAFLFERESILNTVLYAGFEGYRTKLWTFDHVTMEYAGIYEWRGREAAERYGRYAMSMLTPLSVPGSCGYRALPVAQISEEPGRSGERLG